MKPDARHIFRRLKRLWETLEDKAKPILRKKEVVGKSNRKVFVFDTVVSKKEVLSKRQEVAIKYTRMALDKYDWSKYDPWFLLKDGSTLSISCLRRWLKNNTGHGHFKIVGVPNEENQ